MGQIFNWQEKLTVPNALRLSHDEARAEFVRATMEGGRIGKAGKHLAQLCLPHFEHEEKNIFPVLPLLSDLAQGNFRPEMSEVMTMISNFRAKHEALEKHHQAIASAIEDLLQAAQREKSREFTEFAFNLRVHEMTEDEVIYPTVLLIGKYLQEKFAH